MYSVAYLGLGAENLIMLQDPAIHLLVEVHLFASSFVCIQAVTAFVLFTLMFFLL